MIEYLAIQGEYKMIKFNNALLEENIKRLDFSNQMLVNSKYTEILKYVGEESKDKAERLISAYVWHGLINNNFVIETLISSKHFLNKIREMTDAQIERYIDLCTKASLGILITNKTLLKKYSTEDHLRICELHISYQEHPLLASGIEVAGKHKVKFLYIKKIAEILCNAEDKDKYATNLILSDNFYAIKSDFEKLIILEHIIKADNEYEKSLYKHLATNKGFINNNDIYYLIGLVEKLMKLENEQLSTQLVAEINNTPRITQVYSPGDLYVIMNRINESPRVKDFFFNSFILANFESRDIDTIYNIAVSENPESIGQLIAKIKQYKAENKDVIHELEYRMEIANVMKSYNIKNQDITDISYDRNSQEKPKSSSSSLRYTIAADGQWIDA